MCRTTDGEEASGRQIGVRAKCAQRQQLRQEITKEKLQSKRSGWKNDQLSRSWFNGLKEWKTGPSNNIAAVQELYQQLLLIKFYHRKKKDGYEHQPECIV